MYHWNLALIFPSNINNNSYNLMFSQAIADSANILGSEAFVINTGNTDTSHEMGLQKTQKPSIQQNQSANQFANTIQEFKDGSDMPGIGELKINKNYITSLYPNPATNHIFISYNLNKCVKNAYVAITSSTANRVIKIPN